MPGIIGSNAGKRHTSAGHFTIGAISTASRPTTKAATALAGIMFMPNHPGDMSMNRTACPVAAARAHAAYVRRGVLLILEKPIAAIAANIASSKIFNDSTIMRLTKTGLFQEEAERLPNLLIMPL